MSSVDRADRSRRVLAASINLVHDAAAGEIAEALGAAGVPNILLKGPSFRRWLYDDDDAERVSEDIDLLVSDAEMGALGDVLTRKGYRYLGVNTLGAGRPFCQLWQRQPRGVFVEVHTTLAGIAARPEKAWAVLSERTEEMNLGGTRVEVLAAPARALHVALHAVQHGELYGKTLEDLERALERLPLATWAEAARLAERLGATPAFAAGLTLLPRGRDTVKRLGLPEERSVMVVLRARTAPPMADGLEWLASLPGLRPKAAFAARHLIPPAAYMRVWLPIARGGRLGLVVAYAARPFWLLWHAGPAYLAWRRARREIRT